MPNFELSTVAVLSLKIDLQIRWRSTPSISVRETTSENPILVAMYHVIRLPSLGGVRGDCGKVWTPRDWSPTMGRSDGQANFAASCTDVRVDTRQRRSDLIDDSEGERKD
jgi:hypothetical protein